MKIEREVNIEEPCMVNLFGAIQNAIQKAIDIPETFEYGDFDVNKNSLRLVKERLEEAQMWAEKLIDKL